MLESAVIQKCVMIGKYDPIQSVNCVTWTTIVVGDICIVAKDEGVLLITYVFIYLWSFKFKVLWFIASRLWSISVIIIK